MVSFLDGFVVILLIVAVAFYIKKNLIEVKYQEGKKGERFLVRNLDDGDGAALLLSGIADDVEILIRHMLDKNKHDNVALLMKKNFKRENISEGSPSSGYTSYSIDKGAKIVLCIRQKDTNKLVPKNVAMYVMLHEMAHLGTKEVGHTDAFWKNFRHILNNAIEAGVYSKVNFSKDPAPYCGMVIASSVV